MASQNVSTKIKKILEKDTEKKLEKEEENNIKLNDNELDEQEEWIKNENEYKYLYPNLNDPLFNQKIAEKKEFNDTKYDGTIYDNINEEAEKLCNAEFELSPHQQFVKNFLSFQTPYNSLLLYHGLGSGKTCSAIGVAEEMRDYLNQIGKNQRIIVVASPNVQENFRLQLFDERKLVEDDDLWNIKSCTGNKLLREINPLNLRGLTRQKVISQINQLINNSYLFLGYTAFANMIEKNSEVGTSSLIKDKAESIKNKLRKTFDNRLIIIDEVHNIRITDTNSKEKRVSNELLKLVKNVDNLRLLLLSATPLYNNYKEVIWLINIMNLNDKRSSIEVKEVFDKDGRFKINKEGEEGEEGKQLLERKARGYISFVRGNNPYTFPYRIWPDEFAPTKTLKKDIYPNKQLNNKNIIQGQGIQHLSLYMTELNEYQNEGYNYIVNKLTPENRLELENPGQLGYIQLQKPLEALNIVYPNTNLSEYINETKDLTISDDELVGKNGLDNIMTYRKSITPPVITDFEYKKSILDDPHYGRIFSPDKIQKYSSKIKAICNNILNSSGVILIYSLYLDGGLVPIALALEELGITRHGNVKSLFKTAPVSNLDLKTNTNTNSKDSIPAKYIMITGNKMLSPNNVVDLKAATSTNNVNGDKVKVILISQAGAEGLDFKFIRQVHVLEPWYNLSRIEQIIGRAVRNCSHKDLPFEKRNVEIFLYGSYLANKEEEAADLYVYRLAEQKAVQIGHINRLLKEISIDCLLNSEQSNFTEENMNKEVLQILSNGKRIEKYKVGDKPFSAQCDYMERCTYNCRPTNTIGEINKLSYNEAFIEMNTDKIIHIIKQLMKEQYFYSKKDLIPHINQSVTRSKNLIKITKYPSEQIYAALNQLVTDNNEFITDKYNRLGNLINIGDYYFFQPIELNDKNISIYERSVPIPFKHKNIPLQISETTDELPKDVLLSEAVETIEVDIADDPNKLSKPLIPIELDQESEPKKKPLSIPLEIHPGKEVIQNMFKNYTISNTDQLLPRGESNWYKYSSVVLNNLEKDGTPREILEELLISHLIETQLFKDIFNALNYIYSKSDLTKFEQDIKNYFESKLLKHKSVIGILLQGWDGKNAIQKLIILKDKIWTIAEEEDYIDLLPSIKKTIIPKEDLNNILGFITNFKGKDMIFKIKENKKEKKGTRCGTPGKLSATEINNIMGIKYYTETTIKKVRGIELCVFAEYILRLNDFYKKNGKRWFLTPDEVVISNKEDKDRKSDV